MEQASHHVLTRSGDGLGQVDAVLAELAAAGTDRAASGLHRAFYVTRADQTVVMTVGRDSPVARALRGRPGWTEPGDEPLR